MAKTSRNVNIVTYATLINTKTTIPSAATPYFAVEQHFFFDLMAQHLKHVYVDAPWYLSNYPDVRLAVANGDVSGPEEHYRRFGYYEHRTPYEIHVDESWYLDAYADVQAAIEQGHFESGQDHFTALGYKEGRLPFPEFTLRANEIY